jgi:hypothetical protein
MDLTNGNVVSLIGNGIITNQYFYLSVSPKSRELVYVTANNRLVIRNLKTNTEKDTQFNLSADEGISDFIWSPDESRVIFAKLRRDKAFDVISADYLTLDTETGNLIFLLKGSPNFLNVERISDSEVLLGQNLYSLVDGKIIEPAKP